MPRQLFAVFICICAIPTALFAFSIDIESDEIEVNKNLNAIKISVEKQVKTDTNFTKLEIRKDGDTEGKRTIVGRQKRQLDPSEYSNQQPVYPTSPPVYGNPPSYIPPSPVSRGYNVQPPSYNVLPQPRPPIYAVQPPYSGPPSYGSSGDYTFPKSVDPCPPLSGSCPICLQRFSELPYDICSFPVFLRVLTISNPTVDNYGRVCGKFGLVNVLGGTNINEFRRLLRFSFSNTCNCNIQASKRYYILTTVQALIKDGPVYSKISLSDQSFVIPEDRYSNQEVEQLLFTCNGFYPNSPSLYPAQPTYRPRDPYEKPMPRQSVSYANPAVYPPAQNPQVQYPPPALSYSPPVVAYPPANRSYYPQLTTYAPSVITYSPPDRTYSPPFMPIYTTPPPYAPTPKIYNPERPMIVSPSSTVDCLTDPATSPSCAEYSQEEVDAEYCASDFAFVIVIGQELAGYNTGSDSQSYDSSSSSSSCVSKPSRIVYDVSKYNDPIEVGYDIDVLLPADSPCLQLLRGPQVILLLGRYVKLPTRTTQLTENHSFYILPTGTIILPSCKVKPTVPPEFPYVEPEPGMQSYASIQCPDNAEDSCPGCFPSIDQNLKDLYCSSSFAILARLQDSGAYSPSVITLPTVYASTLDEDYERRIQITISKAPAQCRKGSLLVLQDLKQPSYAYTENLLIYWSLQTCNCPYLESSPVTELLLFSQYAPLQFSDGSIQLTKDIYIVPMPISQMYLPQCQPYPVPQIPPPVPAPPPAPVDDNSCLQPTTVCPLCYNELDSNFEQLLCQSETVMVFAMGVNYDEIEKEDDSSYLSFGYPSMPQLNIKRETGERTKMVVEVSTPSRYSSSYKKDKPNTCYREKVRALYDLTNVQNPYEKIINLECYIPRNCQCNVFDTAPGYGIIMSSKKMDLGSGLSTYPLQLTNEYAYFPIPAGKTILPTCNAPQEPYTPNSELVLGEYSDKGQPTFSMPDMESCPDGTKSECPQCHNGLSPSLRDNFCSYEFAVIVKAAEVTQTSLGYQPALKVAKFKDSYDKEKLGVYVESISTSPYGPLYGQNEKTQRRCRPFNLRVLQDLRASRSYDTDPSYQALKAYLLTSCSCHFIDSSIGYALILSKKPPVPKSTMGFQMDSDIQIVCLYGVNNLPVCPPVSDSYKTQPPAPYYATPAYKPSPRPYVVPTPTYKTQPPYNPKPVYGTQPPYSPKPAYPTQPPYNPMPVYATQPPYNPPKPAYPTQPPYNPMPVYATQPPYNPPKPAYPTQPPYNPKPAYPTQPPYNPKPAYPTQPPYNPKPAYPTQPSYTSKPAYTTTPPYVTQPAYPTQAPYNPNPAYPMPQKQAYYPPQNPTNKPPAYYPPQSAGYKPTPPSTYKPALPPPQYYQPPTYPVPPTYKPYVMPTSLPSYTQPPYTQPPYTQPPYTQPPYTQPPYTQPPYTQPPYTQPPYTQPPYTQPPHTQPPYTQPPYTQPPYTQQPTYSNNPTLPQLRRGCLNPADRSCPHCANEYDLSRSNYCSSKFALVGTMASPRHTGASPCKNGLIQLQYNVSPNKAAEVMTGYLNYAVPSHCKCDLLQRYKHILIIVRDAYQQNPQSLQMNDQFELYPLYIGNFKLPVCIVNNVYPRFGTAQDALLPLVDEDLRKLHYEVENAEKCPGDENQGTCPTCNLVTEEAELKHIICSHTDVYLISVQQSATLSNEILPFPNTVYVSQSSSAEQNYSVSIDVKAKNFERCNLPVEIGSCNSNATRYYYDVTINSCTPFEFSGCDRNENNFLTIQDCLSACEREWVCREGQLSILKKLRSTVTDDELTFVISNKCNCATANAGDNKVLLAFNNARTQNTPLQLTKDVYMVAIPKETNFDRIACPISGDTVSTVAPIELSVTTGTDESTETDDSDESSWVSWFKK